MPESVSEEDVYDSHYIAQTVEDILRNQFDYLRYLNDFYGDGSFLSYVEPFKEYSALHGFIAFVAADIISEDSSDTKSKTEQEAVTFSETGELIKEDESTPLTIEEAFDFYGVEYTSFDEQLRSKGDDSLLGITEDDIDEYFDDLVESGEYETLLDSIAEEVFPILFQDRKLLEIFNDIMARQVNDSKLEEIDEEYLEFFSESGILKEVSIPLWVRETVNSRDQGKCADCFKEIVDFDVAQSNRFCYMVPLVDGGLNDITNIQILCRGCDPNVPEDPRQQTLW